MKNVKRKIKKYLKPKTYKLKAKSKGFIALITIIIVSGIVLFVALGISQLSISEAQMGLQTSQSSQAFYLTNLCAEDALMKLKEDSNYPGNEIINIASGSCEILQVEGNWTIKTLGSFQNQIKKVKIVVSQVNPNMIIDSWQEIPEF